MTSYSLANSTEDRLRNQVLDIIKTIETGDYDPNFDEECSASDYLNYALDIRYIVSSRKEFLGAEILVAYGGPTIWINTLYKTVKGTWWSDAFTERYFTDALNLSETLEDYYECL